MTLKRKKKILLSSDDEEEEDKHEATPPPKKKAAVASSSASSSKPSAAPVPKPRKPELKSNGKIKRKRIDEDEYASSPSDDDDEFVVDDAGSEDEKPLKKGPPKGRSNAGSKKTPRKSDASKAKEQPKVKPKTEDAEEGEKPKPKFKCAVTLADLPDSNLNPNAVGQQPRQRSWQGLSPLDRKLCPSLRILTVWLVLPSCSPVNLVPSRVRKLSIWRNGLAGTCIVGVFDSY